MMMVLKALPYVVYAALGGFALAWVGLLIDCLRRERFWPVLDTHRRTRWFWLATFALVNPILTVMYYLFGRRRQPQATHVRMGAVPIGLAAAVVAISGFFVNFPGVTHLWMTPFMGAGGGNGRGVAAHAATIEARNGINSSTVTSSTNHARLACRSIAVVDRGGHALTGLIAALLVDALRELPFVETVEQYGEGRFPPDGRPRPDVFVTVAARSVSVTPVPYATSIAAEIDVSAGRTPWRSSHGYTDGTDPPVLQFHWQGTVQHRSKTVGYESVRHGLAAKNIADAIAEPLAKTFRKWLDQYGPMPELPVGLYGTYRPAALPEPLASLGCTRLYSYSGLMTHSDACWRFELPPGQVAATLKELAGELEGDGWRVLSSSERNLRAGKGGLRLHVYRPSEPVRTGWVVVRDTPSPKPPVLMIARLRDRFSDDERRTALDVLLTETTPADTLLFVSRLFDEDQRKQMYGLLEERTDPSPAVQAELIGHYIGAERYDEAERALRRARALLWASADAGTLESKLRSAAKQLTEKAGREVKVSRQDATLDELRDAGFRAIDANTQPFEVDVGLDEPVLLVQRASDGKLRTLTLRAAAPQNKGARLPYRLPWMACSGNSRSWSEENGALDGAGRWSAEHHWHGQNGRAVRTTFRSADKPGRFTVTVRPEPVRRP